MLRFLLEDFVKKYNADSINLLEVLAKLPKLRMEGGPWLAGGSLLRLVKNEKISKGDLDFFFINSNRRRMARDAIIDGKEMLGYSSHKAEIVNSALGVPIQLVKSYHPTLEDCLNSFDFTICQLGTDGYYLYATEQGWEDIHNNVLRETDNYNDKPHDELRVVKYMIRGYVPEAARLWTYWDSWTFAPIIYGDDNTELDALKIGNSRYFNNNEETLLGLGDND